MHLAVLDQHGNVAFDRNLPTSPDAFLQAIGPFRDDLIVGCECMFGWYWLADCCAHLRWAFGEAACLFLRASERARFWQGQANAARRVPAGSGA